MFFFRELEYWDGVSVMNLMYFCVVIVVVFFFGGVVVILRP